MSLPAIIAVGIVVWFVVGLAVGCVVGRVIALNGDPDDDY